MDLQKIKEEVSKMPLTSRSVMILDVISRIEEGLPLDGFSVEYTLKHNEKMEGLQSVSTSPLVNTNCEKLSHNLKAICFKCFSIRQLARFKSQDLKLIYNALILNYCDLKSEQIPFINASYFRIEAFGDLITMQQLKNYVKIIKLNKYTHFAWFTKRYDLMLEYFKQGGKIPNNCNLILSSPLINTPLNSGLVNTIKQYFKNVKVFTVYDKNHIEKVGYNCLKKCKDCLKCYTSYYNYINESLK